MNGRLNYCPFFYHSPVKTPIKLPKICRSQKIDLTGLRLPGFYDVGKVFVPLKFDALETAPMRLNGQNWFHALFCRLKLRAILGTYALLSVPLIFSVRFVKMAQCQRTTLSSDRPAIYSLRHYGLLQRMSRYCGRYRVA
jgi:hypothetical protein